MTPAAIVDTGTVPTLATHGVETSPCTLACPAGINVKSYVSLIGQGRFAEALSVVREACPLPAVCGRVCTHPCESACRLGETDDPVAIRALKRFVADMEPHVELPASPNPAPKAAKVAIVGSGPAGLTAAWDLRLAGHPVTVFEADSEPGGMLRYGIAAYRLPRDVLAREIARLTSIGIDLRTGSRLGRDFDLMSLFRDGYRAILLATGGGHGRQLGIEGDGHADGVEDAITFLRRANAGDMSHPGNRVLVIGGGSTAVEAARTALRLGADQVEILYRRSRAEMPCSDEEVESALVEGARLRPLVSPHRIVTRDGRLTQLECVRMRLGDPDESGRRRPVPIPDSAFPIDADRVLAAVGQEVELDFLPPRWRSRVNRRDGLKVNPESGMTEVSGVFAAGDLVTGPDTVVGAIGQGHRAARAIARFIKGDAAPETATPAARTEYEMADAPPPRGLRHHPPETELSDRDGFDEVELALEPGAAVDEANRCLRCGPCGECHVCAPTCHRRHFEIHADGSDAPPVRVRGPVDFVEHLPDGHVSARMHLPGADARLSSVTPARCHVEPDRCRGCGACVDVCPYDAIHVDHMDPPVACVAGSACRGCNLCTAVCPTGAVTSLTRPPGWWEDTLESALGNAQPGRIVALACERRVPALAEYPGVAEGLVRIVPVGCVGEITSGRVLDILQRGAANVLVASCADGRCRNGRGPQLARREAEQAKDLLSLSGQDPVVVAVDRERQAGVVPW